VTRALRLGLLCVLFLSGCAAPEEEPPPQRIFLVTLDTLRADHLSCYGYPRPTSPFLDRLAEEGVLFTRAIASASTTVSSHASLFTSLQPPQHRLTRNGMVMHRSLYTLAAMFRDLGYTTAGFSTVGFMKGLGPGFDTLDTEGEYHPNPRVVDRALAWLAERGPEEPFFLWLHLYDVHEWLRPRNVDPEARRRASELEPRGRELARHVVESHGLQLGRFAEEQLLDAIDRYDGQILSVDAGVERLYAAAADRGFDRRALWIVTSDHGEGLGSHGYRGHGAKIYNEQLHVPLIFHTPGSRAGGRRVDRLVRLVDLLPTLAELAGGEELLDRQVFPVVGHSLAPLLDSAGGRFPDDRYPVRFAYSQRRRPDQRRLDFGWEPGDLWSVQTEEHKYVYHSEGEDELYDLRRDPLELENRIAADHETRERLRGLAERLHRTLAEQGRHLKAGKIDPTHLEELRALGYL
jgi:arylsulfatase A-like enzyme